MSESALVKPTETPATDPRQVRTIERRIRIEPAAIDREARTVELAFSRQTPIEDLPGIFFELEHSESAVDLSRLNDGAAVLVNHDPDRHVGTVVRAWIGDDLRGRAIVRFGQSDYAREVFNDIVDGIRKHVSFGAKITGKIERQEQDGGRVTYFVRGWQPFEITIASVPKDAKVGIGRAENPDNQATKRGAIVEQQVSSAERENIARSVQADTAARVAEFYEIGNRFGCLELAQELVTNQKLSDEDRADLLQRAADGYVKAKEKEIDDLEAGKSKPATELGLSKKELQRYSISRALDAYLEGDWKDAAFERECSLEVQRALEDRSPKGFYVPYDIQTRQQDLRAVREIRRELDTGTATGGAEWVGTRHSPENFIEQLRVSVAVIRAGARMLPGMRQNLDIPRKDAAGAFGWIAEGGNATLDDLQTGNVLLSPKTVAGGQSATRRMLKQSLPAIDDMIMQDLAEGAGEAIDLGAIQGSGAANQPTGVVNQTGVNTQVVNPAGQPIWSEVVGFRTAVATDNALRGSMAWITDSAAAGFMMTQEKSSGSGRFIMEPTPGSMFGGAPDNLLGFPVFEQNAITAGTMILGNWSELLLPMWGVLDLRPDPYTNAASDGLVIWAFQDVDVGVRHGASFCKNVLV